MDGGVYLIALLAGGLIGAAVGQAFGYSSCSKLHKKLEEDAAARELDRKASEIIRQTERVESSLAELRANVRGLISCQETMSKWANEITREHNAMQAKVNATEPAPASGTEPEKGGA